MARGGASAGASERDTQLKWGPHNAQNTTNYTYDQADRITSAGALTYSVNAVGNLTSRYISTTATDTFTYDQANRLTGATINGANPAITSAYSYRGDDLRASKTVGSTTTSYLWDLNRSLPTLLVDYDTSGAISRKYVWGPSNLPGQGLAYNEQPASGAVEVYHKDHLGNIRAISDNSQYNNSSLVVWYLTDEFGVITGEQTPCLDSPACTQHAPGSTQPFRFTGELYDGLRLSKSSALEARRSLKMAPGPDGVTSSAWYHNPIAAPQ